MEEALKNIRNTSAKSIVFFVGIIKTDDEVIEEINRCIATDTKQSEPNYEDGCLY